MFFTNFPAIKYNFTSRTDSVQTIETIQDLTTKVGIVITNEDLEKLCFRYTIKSGELPETISYKQYNSPDYDWTITTINSIGNLNAEWPLDDQALLNYAIAKYGAQYLDSIHHYEKIPEGLAMDKSFIISMYGQQYLSEVTNIEYETRLNEQKRYIYLIKSENLASFVKSFLSKLKQ